QNNIVDCGLWVLAVTAAVLRGHDITNLRHHDMGKFRKYLHALVTSMPAQ
ncbi:hypothetical protein BV22DRAFT_1022261, partial [Leucogyrophana mollusca]